MAKPITDPVLAKFTKGQRVRHSGGLTGRVVQVVKSRRVVTVEIDPEHGTACDWYDFLPERLEVVS